jgi:hypothetical protein
MDASVPHYFEGKFMGWRDYFYLYEKHDGDLSKASEGELEVAASIGPIDAVTSRKIAEADYKRKVRNKNNEQNQPKNQKVAGSDRHFADSLFGAMPDR